MFSDDIFQRTGLGAGSDISWRCLFRKDGALDPRLSTMESQFNFTRTIQANISRFLTGNI